MTAEIIPFNFESASNTIRVVEIDGEPWFVAKDVMAALEYAEATLSNVPDKISNVPDVWKGRHPMATLGGLQDLWILSESGLYFFVGRCDKPKALPFQLWIAGEVLPALRKRGYYGSLKPVELLRYHAALSRTVKQLEGTQNALSQNILLQQVRGIASILKVEMPPIAFSRQKARQMDFGSGEAA